MAHTRMGLDILTNSLPFPRAQSASPFLSKLMLHPSLAALGMTPASLQKYGII